MNSQSKKMSLMEAMTNQVVAFAISFVASFGIFPFFGVTMSVWQNLGTVSAFSVVSIIRSYSIRRYFNNLK